MCNLLVNWFKPMLPCIFSILMSWAGLAQNLISLVSPSSNFLTTDTVLTFEWNSLDAAISYDIELSLDDFVSTSEGIYGNAVTIVEVDSLVMSGYYKWRVRSYDGITYSSWSTDSFRVFTPTQIPGIELWLDGSGSMVLNNDSILEWTDQSGEGNNASQILLTQQPFIQNSISELNNHSVVRFDGVNDNLDLTSIDVGAAFVVSNYIGGGNTFASTYGLLNRTINQESHTFRE